MAHRSFGTVRAAVEREAVTFDFGLFGEETFTVIPEPSLGDTFELYDAPEPAPGHELAAARVLARFIRRMLVPEDRQRFDAALFRIPVTEMAVVIDCAEWIARRVMPFPSEPPTTSSGGRPPTTTGDGSSPSPAGTTPSS